MLCIFPSAGRQVIEIQLAARNRLEEKDKSKTWKKAVFLHSVAWTLSVTSATLFTVYLSEDQVCATLLDFGFNQWREIVVFVASYFPILVLLIDFSMNKLIVSLRHLVTNFLILALYFFVAFLGSEIQNRPIYANHLAFRGRYGNNYNYGNHNTTGDVWAADKLEECKAYFNWNPVEGQPDVFTITGWNKALWRTLGLGFATLIVTHLIIVFITRLRKG